MASSYALRKRITVVTIHEATANGGPKQDTNFLCSAACESVLCTTKELEASVHMILQNELNWPLERSRAWHSQNERKCKHRKLDGKIRISSYRASRGSSVRTQRVPAGCDRLRSDLGRHERWLGPHEVSARTLLHPRLGSGASIPVHVVAGCYDERLMPCPVGIWLIKYLNRSVSFRTASRDFQLPSLAMTSSHSARPSSDSRYGVLLGVSKHKKHQTVPVVCWVSAFTPARFALPRGTAPRKRNFHQGRTNLNGTVTSRTYFGHTVCPHTRSKHIT